jgi:transcription initiation factor TFIID subunit 15
VNGHSRPYEGRPPSPRGRPRSPVRPGFEEPAAYPPRRY